MNTVGYSIALWISLQGGHFPESVIDPLMTPGQHTIVMGYRPYRIAMRADGFGACFVLRDVLVNGIPASVTYEVEGDAWVASTAELAPVDDQFKLTIDYTIENACSA